MRYLLDTNVCIAHLNKKEPGIRKRLGALNAQDVFLCSVVKAELLFGARKSVSVQKNLALLELFFRGIPSLPFDDDAAEFYGGNCALLAKTGASIGSNDLMIAAISQANDLVIVTRNADEFRHIPGLRVEVW